MRNYCLNYYYRTLHVCIDKIKLVAYAFDIDGTLYGADARNVNIITQFILYLVLNVWPM